MNRKYKFTGETKKFKGRILHRIRRIEDGLIGGWIEKEGNLSHEGNCFVYDNAMIFGNAKIYDDVRVSDNAMVYDSARIFGDAMVYGYAIVRNNAEIFGNAKVFDNTKVSSDAIVYGNARVHKGEIIGQVCQPYKDIFQCQCENRVLTAILTENDKILYSVGCQSNMTKETFLDIIYNMDGGLEENLHREEYLRLIPLVEMYFGIN